MYDKNSECFELAINLILLENIKVMFNTLKYDYFIFGVADWDLYNCIGYPESYRYYLGRGIIICETPILEKKPFYLKN